MRKSLRSLCLLLTVTCVCNAQLGTLRADSPDAKQHTAPKGFILIEEDLWTGLSDEPGRHLDHAREFYLMKEARKTAAELRKAAIYLKIAARNSADRTRTKLERSAHELDRLAHRVELGTVDAVDEVDAVAARALHTLSDDHYAKATEAWEKRELHRSGHYLRAAADNLERANARTRDALKTGTHEVVKDSRIVAGKLVHGTGFVVDEIGAGFEAFGRQVERVGQGITKHGEVR